MPQGSSAWVWMSIATTSSILGSFSFVILVSRRRRDGTALIVQSCKLVIPYNKFGKTPERQDDLAQAGAFETDFWKHADLWEPDAVIARGPLTCKGWRVCDRAMPATPPPHPREVLGYCPAR